MGIQIDDSEAAIGKFGLDDRNDRGQMFLNFLHQHHLYVMNSFFKKKLHRRWTWVSPGGKTKNEIDFFITRQKRNVRDVTVLNKFCIGSHRAVKATVKINLKNTSAKMVSKKKTVRWSTPESTADYEKCVTMGIKHQQLTNIETLNDTVKEALITAQKQHCKKPISKEEKLSKNTRELIMERRLKRQE